MIRKKRRKIKNILREWNWERIATVLFLFAFPLFIAGSLFLRTHNNSLAVELQSMEREISRLQLENSELNSKIQELTSKQRVMEFAEQTNLELNQDSVLTIIPSKEVE